MTNSTRKNETLWFVLTYIFLTKFVSLSECWETPYREIQCGTLHSQNNLGGQQFPFKDGDESANLFEDYRALLFGWNITSSFLVESGCSMEICNETYFDGVCPLFEEGSYPSLSVLPANFTGGVGSVRCYCRKECKCEDTFMKKSSCARAYFKGGCETCNSLYTELANTSYYDGEDFQGDVEAFRLRKGCRLTLYAEEDFEGEEEIISEEIFENYNGTFSSYECKCNDEEYVPRAPPPRPITFPPLVDVPGSLDDIITMLRNETYSRHPGLETAKKSMENRRSGRNAYILVVGSTGSGKSTAINLLLDNPNITEVGDYVTTTTDINEIRIPVPLDKLGISNSELRIIDTPGLGNTRGIEQDAKFLATLENYLDTHEELKHRIPNVVLIFHNYNDKRLNSSASRFVKLIDALESFRSRITDRNYSNVIFVLSHFCGGSKRDTRWPTNTLKQFKEVIEDVSLFPNPINLVVAENDAEEYKLPLLNGYYKLPNNEYYPRNLFEKMDQVTKNTKDIVGAEIFQTAFRDPENLNVTSSHFPLVDSENPNVVKYMRILTSAWSFLTLASAQKQKAIQKERQDLIMQLEKENYNENRKALIEIKLKEIAVVERISQENKNSERELESSITEMRKQLQESLEDIQQEGGESMYERIESAHYEFYLKLRETRQRVERELKLKTMRYRDHLNNLKDHMKLYTESMRDKFSLQMLTWEREQRKLDLICNWNVTLTQNATDVDTRAKLLQELKGI
ncbi:unnamed protein product [Orchesella dallaii]|uniref:G domain-containing protein n=1 Tax=Orchesella dallaii TaxID=48710 RepID=A0ABP1RYV9_9HEXA